MSEMLDRAAEAHRREFERQMTEENGWDHAAFVRAILETMRVPDMDAVLRVAELTGHRPAHIDLVWARLIGAALDEGTAA